MKTDFEAGVFLIDKPAGVSSFSVVRQVRRILGMKKVGHAGTLDPFATGLLIVCAGRPATKMISSFMDGEKEYVATLHLGVETTTLDPEGEVVSRQTVAPITNERIEAVLKTYTGVQEQVPPVYSALKHKGKPLYYYARKGIEIVKEPRRIEIKVLERIDGESTVSGEDATVTLRIVCSKGTYIRTLAADIGTALGCGAYLTQLRRTRSGCFSVDQSLNLEGYSLDDAREKMLAGGISVADVSKLLQ